MNTIVPADKVSHILTCEDGRTPRVDFDYAGEILHAQRPLVTRDTDYEYYSILNPFDLDVENYNRDRFGEHSGSFDGRIYDAVEAVRQGYGDAITTSNGAPFMSGLSQTIKVIRFIDRAVGESYRQQTMIGFKDSKLAYGLSLHGYYSTRAATLRSVGKSYKTSSDLYVDGLDAVTEYRNKVMHDVTELLMMMAADPGNETNPKWEEPYDQADDFTQVVFLELARRDRDEICEAHRIKFDSLLTRSDLEKILEKTVRITQMLKD